MKENKEMLFNYSIESNTTQTSDQQMNQSFYTKQGLDFLYFARPGTAYGP